MDIKKLSDELMRDESIRFKPYRDSVRSEKYPQGILTIGVGRNLEEVGLSPDEVAMLLQNDIGKVIRELDLRAPWWRGLDEVRQRVLANMVFNMGWPRLSGFHLTLLALENRNFEAAADEMERSSWYKQVGVRGERLVAMMRKGTP